MQKLALSTIGSSHIDEISSSRNEPSWLKEYRKNSLNIYQELPLETSPLYNKYTDAKRMDPKLVSLAINSDKSIPEFNLPLLTMIPALFLVIYFTKYLQKSNRGYLG